MQTIREIGNPRELDAAIGDAFPGSKIDHGQRWVFRIGDAATRADAPPLVSSLAQDLQARRIVLEKELGETLIQADERPSWTWPTR